MKFIFSDENSHIVHHQEYQSNVIFWRKIKYVLTSTNSKIEAGILKPLLELAKSTRVTENFLSNITWTISNLRRNKNTSPPPIVAQESLPVLGKLLQHNNW